MDEDTTSCSVQVLGDASEAGTSNPVASGELDHSIPDSEEQNNRETMAETLYQKIRRTCSADNQRIRLTRSADIGALNIGHRQVCNLRFIVKCSLEMQNEQGAPYSYAWNDWTDGESLEQRSPFSCS